MVLPFYDKIISEAKHPRIKLIDKKKIEYELHIG